jgi:hypothetical protein
MPRHGGGDGLELITLEAESGGAKGGRADRHSRVESCGRGGSWDDHWSAIRDLFLLLVRGGRPRASSRAHPSWRDYGHRSKQDAQELDHLHFRLLRSIVCMGGTSTSNVAATLSGGNENPSPNPGVRYAVLPPSFHLLPKLLRHQLLCIFVLHVLLPKHIKRCNFLEPRLGVHHPPQRSVRP